MKKLALLLLLFPIFASAGWFGDFVSSLRNVSTDLNLGAPNTQLIYQKTILPVTDNIYDLGTSTQAWRDIFTNSLTFQGEIQPDGSTCSNGQILKKTGSNDWDCAADDQGAGGTGSNFTYVTDAFGDFLKPSTTVGLIISASSTILGDFTVSGNATTTGLLEVGGTSTSTFAGGISIADILQLTGNATSSAANGLNLSAGCFAINGVCVGGSGHAAVTLSGTPTYITLSGQDIVRGLITLTTDVTGTLPIANGGTALTAVGASSTILTTDGAVNAYTARPQLEDIYITGVNSTSTITNGLTISGALGITPLVSCDTVDTDANGILRCGSDGGGAGTPENEWQMLLIGGTNYLQPTSTTAVFARSGLIANASSTINSTFNLPTLSDGNLVVYGGTVLSNASTTFSSGLTYAAGNVTNTGVLSISGTFPIVNSLSTGDIILSCPSCLVDQNWSMGAIGGTNYIQPTTTITTFHNNGFISNASSSILGDLFIDGWATTTGSLDIQGTASSTFTGGLTVSSGALRLTGLTSCDTIDTDVNGILKCGTDTSTAGAGSDVIYLATGGTTYYVASSTASDNLSWRFNNGFVSSASSTIVGDFVLKDQSSFYWDNTNAFLGLGSSTPGSILSIGGAATGWNFNTAATTTKNGAAGTGGIDIKDGCFAINGTCVGGGGSANATTNSSIQPVSCVPDTAGLSGIDISEVQGYTAGNAFWQNLVMTNNKISIDVITFANSTTSSATCKFIIPEDVAGTPAASIVFQGLATTTGGGIVVWDADAYAITPSETTNPSLDPAGVSLTNLVASTSAGNRMTMPTTAFNSTTTPAYSLSALTLSAGTEVYIRILRWANDAAETHDDDFFMRDPRIKIDRKVN